MHFVDHVPDQDMTFHVNPTARIERLWDSDSTPHAGPSKALKSNPGGYWV